MVVALISRATRDDGEASAAEEENEGSRFQPSGLLWMEKWIFFAESAPLPRSSRHARDPEEARAIPARGVSSRSSRRRDCRTPFGPRRRSRAPRSTPDLSPDPKFREARHFLVVACPSARARPACPRRSALRCSPTSARLRALPPAISFELCSGSRPRTPTPPWCPTRRSAPSRSWGARRTPRISSAISTRRTDAPRPWTSLAPRTTPPSQHPPRHPPPLERFHRSHPPLGRSSPDRARRRGSRGVPPSGAVTHRSREADDTTGSGVEPEMIRGSGGHDGFGGVARNREGNDGIERATRHTRTFATRHALLPHAPPSYARAPRIPRSSLFS